MENPCNNQKIIEKIKKDDNANFYLINKDIGFPSFSIIHKIRKITGLKKVGFSGTLDPLATGLMIIATSSATKFLDAFHFLGKTYIATIELGKISDTYDKEGNVKTIKIDKKPSKKEIGGVIKKYFTGLVMQTPPIFSAKKINGERLYKMARNNETPKIKPVEINIEKIKILNYKYPILQLEINCSKGTYIRSIANDLGEKLGTGAMLVALERTKIGDFNLKKSINVKDINITTLENKKLKIQNIVKKIK